MATDLSKLQPIVTDLTSAERKRIIEQIQRHGHADRCRQALVTLNERQFVIHHGALWIDDDVLGHVNLIVDGDLIVNGTYGDSEQMLIVLGDMRCENMVATGGLYVRGDLVCGGLSYHYYNDWSMEVEGTLAARAHIEDDRGVLAGAWQVEARGDIGCSAEAACCLLGFRDGRSDPDEDDEEDESITEARWRIERAREHASTDLDLSALELKALPEELFELTWLEALDLSFNELTTLPERLGELTSLVHLSLARNDLSVLPDGIGQLQALESLSLHGNRLRALPDSTGNLLALEELDLGENRLEHLPDSLAQLQKLQSIDLSQNRLEYLPAALGQLPDLAMLIINKNPLRELPASLKGTGIIGLGTFTPFSGKLPPLDDDGDDACATTGSAGEKPTLPAYYRCGEMLAERRHLGEAIFASPLPPMAELVARFGEDWAWRKRLWNPDRARDPHGIDWRLLAARGETWLFELIVSKTLPAAAFSDYRQHPSSRIRWALASARHCPEPDLRVLAVDAEATVRAAVAGHPATPPEVRATLRNDSDWRVRASTLLVPRTGPWAAPDPAVLDHLAGDADARVRTVVASLPDLPSSLVTQLYDDPDATVRSRIPRCQTLSTEIWQRLAHDADPKVRLSAAGQAFRGEPPFNAPEQQAVRNRILQTLMLDSVDAVREEAANAWQAFAFYEQHAATMVEDSVTSVRRLLARITRNPVILSTLVIDSDSSVSEDALANPNTPATAIEACCQRVISEIAAIDKIETVDIDPMDYILRSQDPVFKAQAEAMRTKEQRLDAQLDQMRALGARPELPERFVSAFVDLEIRFGVRLFDDAACLSPPQMQKRWRAELASEDCGDAQCPCHHEERTFLQHLEPCSHDASTYREFFHHVIKEGDRNHRGQALASRHCPPELLAQAVQAHLDGADDGEYDYAIRYMAANPALSDATRQTLVQRVIEQQDHDVISGLARNPTVSAVEWRTIGANTQSPHYAEARDALWLWHGEDLRSTP